MALMKGCLVLMAICGLCSCANMNSQVAEEAFAKTLQIENYLHEEAFASQELPISLDSNDLLTLPQTTKRYLDQYVIGLKTERERYEALRAWVFDRFSDYQYDASETLTISNLINDRKINCLSFSNLFVAAARYVGVPAQVQLVYAPPYWDVASGVWVVNQHVNVYGDIHLEKNDRTVISDSTWYFNRNHIYYTYPSEKLSTKPQSTQRYIADLNRAVVSVPFKTRDINDQQLLSLFYNNKASEAIQSKQLAKAYAYLKAALNADRSLASIWNNLGVLYQQQNHLEWAKQVYLVANQLDENAYSSKTNLANVYFALGEFEKAEELEQEIADYRDANPYYHYALGEQSFEDQELQMAAKHFQQSVELKHNEQLFYYALAKTHVMLGNNDKVAENLKSARLYAKGAEKRRYSNKLKQFEQAVAAAKH